MSANCASVKGPKVVNKTKSDMLQLLKVCCMRGFNDQITCGNASIAGEIIENCECHLLVANTKRHLISRGGRIGRWD